MDLQKTPIEWTDWTEWVRGIIDTVRDAGCKVFLKDSVQDWWPDTLREFP